MLLRRDVTNTDDKPDVASQSTMRIGVWLLLLGVVAAEIVALRLSSTLKYMPLRESPAGFDQLLAFLPAVVKAMLLTGTGMLIALVASAPADLKTILFAHRPRRITVVLNLACFAALSSIFALTGAGDAQSEGASEWFPGLIHATPIFWFFLLGSWANFVAPCGLWQWTRRRNSPAWVIAFFVSILSFYNFDATLASRIGSLLIKPTLSAASELYALTGNVLACNSTSSERYPICGSNSFFVEIQPACSGFEGIMLSATLLGFYFYLEARKISVSQAALVILVACVAIFGLNAVRLALLIYIGDHLSADIAREGFHTNFGLASLVVVLVIAVASSKLFIRPKAPTERFLLKCAILDAESGANARLFIPLTYLIGSSLFFGLFSGKFFWLYPLPLLVTVGGLIQIRAELRGLTFSLTGAPFFLAIVTFLVWLLLVPTNAEKAEIFQASLLSAPGPVIVLWLLVRLFGSICIVPLAEELAFRGTFNVMIYNGLRPYWSAAAAQAGAVALTAVFFGLLHSNFLAGAIAGAAFGFARWRRNELGDAVLCHSFTNLLLSFYILVTGRWSYWP